MTKSESLRQELTSLRNFFVENGCSAQDALRMNAIRAELLTLARRRRASRTRREILFDINGHHGRA